MIFSKTFGYAVRGVLFLAYRQDEKRFVQVEEVAHNLGVPRHFMGKILKKLAKDGVLTSSKGASGGFRINERTLELPLIRLIEITNGLPLLTNCVLNVKECNPENPCPLHFQVEAVKSGLIKILSGNAIKDLLDQDNDDFIKSISTNAEDKFLSLPTGKIY
jgi:Rrf2 family transcriptional regulator, iron-sulfur cluster assembly transcription factor